MIVNVLFIISADIPIPSNVADPVTPVVVVPAPVNPKVIDPDVSADGVIDEIVSEPLGGAHRDYDLMSENIKGSLIRNLSILNKLSIEDLLERRYKRILSIGS